MSPTRITVLLIEDNPGDARLIKTMLAHDIGWDCIFECVERLSAGEQRIMQGGIDVVLLDLDLPDSTGIDTLRRLRNIPMQLPAIVIMSGHGEEEVSIQAVHEGAQDYLVKGKCDSAILIRSIRYAIERNKTEEELRKARDELELRVRERTESLQVEINERKRSEAALLEIKTQWERTFDAVPDLIAILDKQQRILRVNKAMADRYGIPREKCVGMLCYNLVHCSDMPPDNCPHHQFMRDGLPHVVEVNDSKLNTNFLVSVDPLPNPNGEIIGCVHIARDVSEIKQAEFSLHRLNRELRAISDCNETMVRAVDEQTLLDDICRIICQVASYRMAWVGYTEHDEYKSVQPVAWAGAEDGYLAHANITWSDTEFGRGPTGTAVRCGVSCCIQDFETTPQAAPWRENALKRGYRSNIALPLKDENAQPFGVLTIYSSEPNAFTPNEIHLLEELADNLSFGIGVLRARIERKRAEETLQQTLAQLQAIYDGMVAGLVITDIETNRFVRVNASFCTMLGYSQNELLTMSVKDIHPIEEVPNDLQRFQIAAEGGISINENRPILRKDGSLFYTNITAHRIIYEGRPCVLALISDITERKKAEEELHKMQAQLAHVTRLTTMGELVAGIAHEVNQPLYSILNYAKACANILSNDTPSLNTLRKWNTDIAASAARAGEIIKRMRDFAQKSELQQLVTNINDLIDESIALVTFEIRHHNVTMQKYIAEPDLSAMTDRIQIQQVLVNLLRNAYEALEQKPVESRQLIISAARTGEFIEISVSDNGPGLPDIVALQVFDPFVTTKQDGLGMGLAISKTIVEAHGGRIWATANPDGGAVFHFTLPVAIPELINVK